MKGKIIRIVEKGKFKMFLIWLEKQKVCGRTYSGPSYRNYDYWEELKVGDWLDGLVWKDESRKLLDADSHIFIV